MKRLAIVLMAMTVLATGVGAQDAARLLKTAMNTEMVDGNLKGAIEQYKKVAEGSDRALAAQALLRMAGCYEKLGDPQARIIYERIVRDYSDQKEVASARAALGATTSGRSEEIAPRRVWTGTDQVAVSPDGRYLTHQGPQSDTLFLRDLATGAERRLTGDPPAGSRIFWSAFSKDGTEVAYNTCKGAGLTDCELRIVPTRGTGLPTSRRVYASFDAYPVPSDWSPDGKWIAANLRRNDRTTTHVVLIPTSGGTVSQLTTVNWGSVPPIRFSPDGRDVALTLRNEKGEADVFLFAIDGSSRVPVVSNAGDDSLIGWSPDGKFLLYKNDGEGTHLWAQEIANRKPQGLPRLVKLGIGGGASRGLTKTGSLYLGRVRAGWTIEVASVELDTGAQTAPLTTLDTRSDGFATQPVWATDGKSLAYIFNPSSGDAVVAIRSVDTGALRELHLKPSLGNVQQLSWVSDGSSFLVWGRDQKGRDGVFRIAMTGDVAPVVLATAGQVGSSGLEFAPDGTRMYYRRGGAIHERLFESATDRVVIAETPNAGSSFGAISVSPDGRSIATSRLDAATGSSVAIVVPLNGGEPRELLRVKQPGRLTSATWTPDGRALMMMQSAGEDAMTRELWLVPVDGTTARKLDVDATRLAVDLHGRVRVHPSGKRMAFVTGAIQKEVWVFENVLASDNAKP